MRWAAFLQWSRTFFALERGGVGGGDWNKGEGAGPLMAGSAQSVGGTQWEKGPKPKKKNCAQRKPMSSKDGATQNKKAKKVGWEAGCWRLCTKVH